MRICAAITQVYAIYRLVMDLADDVSLWSSFSSPLFLSLTAVAFVIWLVGHLSKRKETTMTDEKRRGPSAMFSADGDGSAVTLTECVVVAPTVAKVTNGGQFIGTRSFFGSGIGDAGTPPAERDVQKISLHEKLQAKLARRKRRFDRS